VSKVLLVERCRFLARASKELLGEIGCSIAARVEDADQIPDHLKKGSIRIIMINNHTGQVDCCSVVRKIRESTTDIPILINTASADPDFVLWVATKSGLGLIVGPWQPEEIRSAVISLEQQGRYLCSNSITLITGPQPTPEPPHKEIASLSAREMQVAEGVCKGLPNKIIASKLGISEKTVRNHRQAVYKKTDSHCNVDLIRKMLQQRPDFSLNSVLPEYHDRERRLS
jgi:DNA-binding NarL/FixJ family response regulator